MSYLKYLISVERITATLVASYGSGTYYRCMYAKDVDKSYLHHHTVSISKFSAHTELLSGRISVPGHIVIDYRCPGRSITPNDEDNVIAALEHPDRVCYVMLYVMGTQFGKIVTVMQEPFPVLTHLFIGSDDGNAQVLPGGFLGGSAPCLQAVYLQGIPFPVLPTLLLSAGDLVELDLPNIPPNGYISPEAMVASLAALPRPKLFIFEFQSATSRPDRIRPPPVTRAVLPALTFFQFQGAGEYLEDFISRIDGPQLNQISIFYFNQLVDFQVAQLSKFIDRSVGSEKTLFRHAQVTFFSDKVSLTMYPDSNHSPWDRRPAWTTILCQGIDWQVSHMAQVLIHFSATLSTVVHLKLEVQLKGGRQLEGTDDVEWLHLLYQFSTVQTLHVSRRLAGHVALALEDITGEMVAEVLPSIDFIRVAGQPSSSIEKSVAVRRLSGRPVAVIDTETEFDESVKSYVRK